MQREHHCHAIGCHNECPPKHLMCPGCWDKVPRTLQAEVYNTVNLRGKSIDGTWAPWWRAQARAIISIATMSTEAKDRYLRKELAFAATLERKTKERDRVRQ